METQLNKLACGNCGHGSFAMYGRLPHKVFVQCRQCKSTTVIKPFYEPILELGWGELAEGILCQMEPDS